MDLVRHVDARYRTIGSAAGRAIAGHSMGGLGAIWAGMQHPDVFSVVYGINPCCLCCLAAERVPERARALTADLSRGRFDQKWGALTAALWLQEEPGPPAEALRRFIVAGPAGVWDLADRHLPDALRGVLREVRATADR